MTLRNQGFSDKCLEGTICQMIKLLKDELASLQAVKVEFELMNKEAIEKIATNLRCVVDGGSEDFKIAMQAF